MVWVMFLFQAEDGIRELGRSRGLGDGEKRQVQGGSPADKGDERELKRVDGRQRQMVVKDRSSISLSAPSSGSLGLPLQQISF